MNRFTWIDSFKGSHFHSFARLFGHVSACEKIIQGFAIDSREIQKGEIFFALPGNKVDGHDFLQEVAFKGALGAFVSKEYQGPHFGLQLISVENVRFTLHKLAKMAFSNRKEKVIAVTGSVGKTTSKEFIAHLLQERYRVAKTLGNANSQLSLPLMLLNLDQEYDFLLLEMGMSQKEEIKNFVTIAPPDLAVVTKVALGHAAFFPNGIEGIAAAKAEIFSQSRTKMGIINEQAMKFRAFQECAIESIKIFSTEEKTKAPYKLVRSEQGFQIHEKESISPFFSLPFSASHLIENFLAAALTTREMGMQWEEILNRAKSLKPHYLRFEVFEREKITFVQDCYNANPESMRSALMNLPVPNFHGRRFGALGSMKELGTFSEESHRQIISLAMECLDHLFLLGPEWEVTRDLLKDWKKPVLWCKDLMELKTHLKASVQQGDVVLIKGSKPHQMWKILEEK